MNTHIVAFLLFGVLTLFLYNVVLPVSRARRELVKDKVPAGEMADFNLALCWLMTISCFGISVFATIQIIKEIV